MKTQEVKQPLISIVIPVYNVAPYLSKCLDSVVAQTYAHLEIILVDDGSTDESTKIVKKYADQDDRISVITTENHGLSAARNTGKRAAHGEYLTFIDSDDYITDDYIAFLWNLILESNGRAHLAICSLYNVFPNGRVVDNGDHSNQIISGEDCIRKMCYHDLVDTCAYAKLARRELYDTVDFPEGRLFEDIATTYQLFMQCDEVACGFSPKYYYVLRKNSIVNSKFSDAKLDLLEMTDRMANDVTARYPDLAQAVLRRQVYARFSTLNQMFNVHDQHAVEIRNQLLRFIKKNQKVVLHDAETPHRDILAIKALSFGYPVYRVMWKVYLKATKSV